MGNKKKFKKSKGLKKKTINSNAMPKKSSNPKKKNQPDASDWVKLISLSWWIGCTPYFTFAG